MSTATAGRAREHRVRDHLTDRDEARFFAKVRQEGDCWVWTAARTGGGYGNFTVRRVNITAHRWCWAFMRGWVPEGLQLDHLCRNRACVNPWHLEPVTLRVNLARGIHAQRSKTSCKRGHPLKGANLGRQNGGHRYCKTCKRATDAKRYPA